MKKHSSFLAGVAAFFFCTNQLLAQQTAGLTLPPLHSGLQTYTQPRRWRGLNLAQFIGTANTATGTQALSGCTSCYQNVADGYQAMYAITSGEGNTGVGFSALYLVGAGYNNTAVGWAALNINTASANTALGYAAMEGNSTGSENTGIGAASLGTSTGSYNTAAGFFSLANAAAESYSTALGSSALGDSHSSTGYNTAIGANALLGYTMQGYGPGNTGSYNLAAGADAMQNNTTGSYNMALGYQAMYENSSGSFNSAGGYIGLFNNTTGSFNATSGYGALYYNTTGGNNTAIGSATLLSNSTGSSNTALGYYANTASGALTNATAVGANATVMTSNQVVIGSTGVTSIGGYANWSNFSDGRFKKNIQPNVPGLAFINKLTPVTYTLDISGIEAKLHKNDPSLPDNGGGGRTHYLDDPVAKQAIQEKSSVTYTGFVAQDVEKAADLIGFAFSGVDKPKNIDQSFYALRYGDFVPPLVKAVQELSSKFDSLQSQVSELRAMVLAQKASAASGAPGASLDQNAPNPFTGSTVIGYNLPKGVSSAQMEITDATGKVLALIPLSGSGRNTLTANVSGYASGTYNYSLIVNGQLVSTRQMISVR